MTLRFKTFLTGLLALMMALTMGLASVQAKPALGGYQLFEQAQSEIEAPIQLASLGNFDWSTETASEYANAPNSLPNVPGRVQSRVNLETNGWNHVVDRHFNPNKNASQFTISQSELRTLLQSPTVVQTPVTRTLQSADGIRYVREVNVGRPIGTDKFSSNQSTSTMTVLSDRFGNLVTATPGKIQ